MLFSFGLSKAKLILIAVLAVVTPFCWGDELVPFSSDGCSLFPDANVITKKNWCGCCFAHDVAYWRGGTKDERKYADQQLKQCILEKTGDDLLAKVMYEGVRFGGSPYFYNWYRWGYGWSFERKYQELTLKEKNQSDKLLESFLSEPSNLICE